MLFSVRLLHQRADVVPIPGSRTAAHITANAAASSIELTPETMQRIDAVREAFQPMGGNMLVAPGVTES